MQQIIDIETSPKNIEPNGSKSQKDVPSIPIDQIVSAYSQPRRYFDREAIEQLVASIKKNGILQPLLVRPLADKYEIVAGERRYRGAMELGLTAVPVTVREMTDAEALQYSLVENLQRHNLNPVEETEGILQLLASRLESELNDVVSLLYRLENEAKGKITQSALGNYLPVVEQVFADLGNKNWRSFVSTKLPLLKLPPEILEALRRGRIDYTKAKEIAKLESESERVKLLEQAIAQSMSLRQIQKLVKQKKASKKLGGELQTEMEDIFKRAKKFSAWDDPDKCDKLKSLLAELKLLLAESN
ncbi:MAG: ParB/RepB/Spo0J family partition protein [Cyanobacteriota bacterium]|nr:ParB/RepB/Spo0J family partition protein [Cyanobacteriota bacterium]